MAGYCTLDLGAFKLPEPLEVILGHIVILVLMFGGVNENCLLGRGTKKPHS
jgi:hypothetical protein